MRRIDPKWILTIILWLLAFGVGIVCALVLAGVVLTGAIGWNEALVLIFGAPMAIGFIVAGAVVAFGKFDNPLYP